MQAKDRRVGGWGCKFKTWGSTQWRGGVGGWEGGGNINRACDAEAVCHARLQEKD